MLTGAALATTNRLPVLLLPSDIFATRVGSPVLQELELPSGYDISVNDAFRPLSRFFDRVWRPEQLPQAMLGAMRVLTDPAETGAVTLALPQDVQAEAHDWPEELFAKRVWYVPRPVPEPAALARAAAAIRAAEAATAHLRRWSPLQRGDRCAAAVRGSHRDPGRGHPGRQGRDLLGSPAGCRRSGLDRVARRQRPGPGRRRGHRRRHQVQRLHHRLQDGIPEPGRPFVNLNVTGLDAAKHAGVMLVADARNGLQALTAELSGLLRRRRLYRAAHRASTSAGTRSSTTPTTWTMARCRRRPRCSARSTIHRPDRHRRPGRRLHAR